MNFKQWLENSIKSYAYEDEKNELDGYIDPDFLYNKNDLIAGAGAKILAFIYTTDYRIFYSKTYNDTHYEISDENELDSSPHFNPHNQNLHGRLAAINGRIYVSFWEDKPEILSALLKPCLRKLESDGHIDFNRDMVSLPNHGTIPIFQLPSNFKKLSPAEQERQDLMRRLHLMNAQQKKEAMAKLGLASGYKKSPWQIESDKLGITIPGKRLWALNSENFSPNNLPYGWIDPQGNYYPLRGQNNHVDGSRLHGFSGKNYDEPMKAGWLRVVYFNNWKNIEIGINNDFLPPNRKQLKTTIDMAIENNARYVYFDDGRDNKIIWSNDEKL